jgi:hypothetical protein
LNTYLLNTELLAGRTFLGFVDHTHSALLVGILSTNMLRV